MPKFTWNDEVRVLQPVSAPDRRGLRESVIGIFGQRPPASHFAQFPVRYSVEFADGEALDLHEDDLAAGEAPDAGGRGEGSAESGFVRDGGGS